MKTIEKQIRMCSLGLKWAYRDQNLILSGNLIANMWEGYVERGLNQIE